MDEMNEMNETMGATVVANEETAISTEVESKGLSTNAIAGIATGVGVVVGIGVTYIPKAIRWVKNKIEKRKLEKLENHYVNIEEDKNDLE